MGKMGKSRRNSYTKQTNIRTEESCTKKSCSKIKKRTQNNAHTLLEKYKNILGSRQLVVVLEKCSILNNISQSSSLQVSSKNSVNNTNDVNHTSKLVHSTNNVSHQSPCVEKTTNHKSVHNLKVGRSKSSKINPKQAAVNKIYYLLGEVSSNTKVSKNVSKKSSTRSKRNASSKRKRPIPKIYESDSTSGSEEIMGEVDTKHEVNAKPKTLKRGKIFKICLERIILYDNNSNVTNVANDSDHLQKNKLNEKITEPQKCNTETEIADTVNICKKRDIYTHSTDCQSSEADSTYIPTTDFSINDTVTTDTKEREVCPSKNVDLLSLQEKFAILHGNYLTKHNAERIVVDINESTKSEDDTTFLASKNLNDINLEETLIEPRSKELSKHTKKHTVARSSKRTIIEDTEDTLSSSTGNLSNSSTNIVQSSERFIMPRSNELSKHTKKHTVTRSPIRTIIEDTEDTLSSSTGNLSNSSTNIVQSSERFIMPRSNELSKHTKKHTVTRSPIRTIIKDTEHTLSASSRNLSNSSTNIVQSSERFIMPRSNELSKHTKKHTVTRSPIGTIIKDTEHTLSASSRNLSNSSTNIVQSSERFIMPRSNELSKHTKKHTVTRSPIRTIIKDTEDTLSSSTGDLSNSSTNIVQSSERFIMPRSNELSKHTKKHSVTRSPKRTIIENTEDTLSSSTGNLSNSSTNIVQYSERFIMPRSNELRKHTKKHTVTRSPKRTIIENTEDSLSASARNLINSSTNIVQSSKRSIVPRSNELSKHTKKHIVTRSPKRTIIENTEDSLSASARNLINSSTNIVQSSKRSIVPRSNELSKHTKKHTVTRSPIRTIIKDTEDTLSASSRNLINSSTNIVQSSRRSTVSCSNDSKKQTKGSSAVNIQKSIEVKEEVSNENNVEHDASHRQYEQKSLLKQKRVHSEDSSSSQDVKKIKLNRVSWRKRLESVDKPVDTSKEVDKTMELVELKKNKEIPQLMCAEVPRPSTVFPEEGNITHGIQVAEANLTTERVVSSIEKQNSTETFGYSNRLECDTRKNARTSQNAATEISVLQETPTEIQIPVVENTSSFSDFTNFNNSCPQYDEDDCISLYADSKLIEEYDVPETFQSWRMNEAPLDTEKQYSMTSKMFDIFYNKNAFEFNEAYDVNCSNNNNTSIVPQRRKSTKIDPQRVKPVETVSQREKSVETVSQREKSAETVSQREKSAETVSQREKSAETVSQREKSAETVSQREKSAETVSQREKSAETVSQREKSAETVSQREKSAETFSQREKSAETVSQREKSAETVSQREKSAETIPQMEKLVEIVPKREKSVETVSQREKQMEHVQTVPRDNTARLTLNPQTWLNMRTTHQSNQDGFLSVFRGFCYMTIRTGVCYRNPCHFNHDFIPHLTLLYNNNETRFFEVIDNLVQKRHTMFLKSFYQECIRPDTNLIYVLKLLKKLCNSNIIAQPIIYSSIKQMIVCGASVNQIVDNLVKIVNNSDKQFIASVLKVLVTYAAPGNGWPMLKPLLTQIDIVPEDVIQHLLIDCITTRKHILDVYEHVVRKLHYESLTLLNQNFLIQFQRIYRQISENVKVQETVASTSDTIASPNPFSEVKIIPYTVQTANLSPKVWKNVVFDGNNNAQGGDSSVLLQPIDNIPNPYSKHSRERFWKFYLDVHSLEEGLKHKDYRHVKKILDEAQKRHVSPFTNACYNILRSKVQHSQAHLSKLASLAVQNGATATFCKIIIDVTIHILADLAERELWVLALALLKSLDGILHEQSSLFKFNAVVTMLFCEIYLANRKPMKAFNLLKQSNILCTYRGKWKVRNNERDDDIRTQIVTILLDMFCDTSPEHAFSLFEFIIVDQSSNFYPIDLSRQVNKLVSLLLLKNDHELIMSMGKLIDDYNCTLYPITHRALISSLVRINLPLAKQLYQNAVLLGIYPKMQFYPIMYIIVKSDWTGEEMYLAIWAMMQKFLENIGHAIKGVKPNNISSYLVFEATPLGKQLVNYKGMDEQYEKKRRGSIELMKNVLKTEFDPPLFLVKKRKDKLQKINSVSLYRYLQCNQNCM